MEFYCPALSIIEQLHKENEDLRVKMKTTEKANEKLRKELSTVTNTHKRRSTGTDYSERHLRRLKRERTTTCASLKWLERQGYVPLKLEVVNEKRGDVETLILYKQCCEEIFGQGNVTDMS